MPCHSTRGSAQTGSPGQRGEPREPGLCFGQSTLLPTGTVLSPGKGQEARASCVCTGSPTSAEPHGVAGQTEPLQVLGDIRQLLQREACPPKSCSGGKAAPHRPPLSQQHPAGAGMELWSWAVQAHERLRWQLPRAGTGTGERSPARPHSDSARWTPLSNERTLRPERGTAQPRSTHCKHCEPRGSCRTRELGAWTSPSILQNPLPLDSAVPHGFGDSNRNTLYFIFLGINSRLT